MTKKPDRSNGVYEMHTDPKTPTKDPAGSKSDGPKTRQSLRQTRRGTVDHAQRQHGAVRARRTTPDIVAGAEDAPPKPRLASRKLAPTSEMTPTLATIDLNPLPIVDQSMDDFIDECYDQIRRLSTPGVSRDTLVDLISSLRSNQDRQSWTDGSEWQALVASGHGDKTRGSFKHAVTLICFANWHEAQVRLTVAASQVARSKATRSVSGRILGAKPSATDHARLWERRRSSLNTQLARGRKWARLVTEFTLGILLVNLWSVTLLT